jgi:transposase InsO family protein
VRYRFVHQHVQQFPITLLCRVLEVSPSGYYAWRTRPESPRQQANRALVGQIQAVQTHSRGTYGRRRVQAQLRAQGVPCSANRVARLMRQHGLLARPRRRFRVTTDSRHCFPVAPNRLGRDFSASAPDQVWVSDITYLATDEGWLYLATVLDLYSRRIVGWAMQPTLEKSLTLSALEMAVAQRQPAPGLIHHSDRGIQYACGDYQARLTRHGMRCSMSRQGDPWDNAPQESFYGSLKGELTHDRHASRAQARREVFEYIEVFYNRQRLHSSLGYLSPVAFERQPAAKAA